MAEGFDDPKSTESRDAAREKLHKRVRGFQKNSPGPYPPNARMRNSLFPKAGSEAVVPPTRPGPPCIQIAIETDVSEALQGMDIHQEERMSEVSSDTENDLLREDPEEESTLPPEEKDDAESESLLPVPALEPTLSTSSAPTLPLNNMSQAVLAHITALMENIRKQGKLSEENILAACELLEVVEEEFLVKQGPVDPQTECMKADKYAEAEIRRIAAEENLIRLKMMAEREKRERRREEDERGERRRAKEMEAKRGEEAREIARHARLMEAKEIGQQE
ncbi:MAP7 domain-containing protein 1-like [Palaemon carinicauda]|uniref:MAP7 domain-containing protein 1-like n=1 Tax=Palaemon carinicauda TaxID=392227 RepID=UPI0035B5B81B